MNPTHEINGTPFWIEEDASGWGWSTRHHIYGNDSFATQSEAVGDAIRYVLEMGKPVESDNYQAEVSQFWSRRDYA